MPTTPTTRYGLPKLDGSDFGDEIDEVTGAAMDEIDAIMATAYSGLLSARPAAGKLGRAYHATDTGYVYFDTGAEWQPIYDAGAYTSLSPINANGWYMGSYSGTIQQTKARRKDDWVQLGGGVWRSAASTGVSVIAVLPPAFRPSAAAFEDNNPRFVVPYGPASLGLVGWPATGYAQIEIKTSGEIRCGTNMAANTGLFLSGISYLI